MSHQNQRYHPNQKLSDVNCFMVGIANDFLVSHRMHSLSAFEILSADFETASLLKRQNQDASLRHHSATRATLNR
jgi:hypothetical protein